MSNTDKEVIAQRALTGQHVELLCCHCGEVVMTVQGYDAAPFCKTLTGRLICEPCWEQVKSGGVVPLRAIPQARM